MQEYIDRIIQMSNFGKNGLLGNQLFQYFFINILKNHYNCDIRLPISHGNTSYLFDTNIYQPQIENATYFSFSDENRFIGPANDLANLNLLIDKPDTIAIDINGYFQYHTSHYDEPLRREIFLELFSQKSSGSKFRETTFKTILRQNLLGLDHYFAGRQLFSIHCRRGDYLNLSKVLGGPFFMPDFDLVLEQVKNICMASGLRDTVIYICSDDLDYCRSAFSRHNLSYVCSDNFYDPKSTNSDTLLMLDVAAMVRSDFLVIANSTLSVFASMLNERGKLFLRPDPNSDGLISFHPWNTHVLFKKQKPT